MIIEIRRAGFVNKGAELMLHAIVEQLRTRYPDAKLTMAPIYGGTEDTFERMLNLRLFPKAWLWIHGFNLGSFANILPEKLLRMYGLVLDHKVNVVLDAAGFSYSDQWGTRSSRELASSSRKWMKNGTKLILLPQALGPFDNKDIKTLTKKWISNANLIFARETDSYHYLTGLVGEKDKIKLYPDFTNLLEGVLPEGYEANSRRIALVPNYRMIDKTSKEESEAYLPFMIRCAKHLVEQGAKPFVLVHEGTKDKMLADKISDAAGGIPIIQETNPLHIKGILGTCEATIGSRFHGLVSALSQGIPSLATGWSHKYMRLFEDYDFKEGILKTLCSDEEMRKKINWLISPESSQQLRQRIKQASEKQKKLSKEMWQLVFSEIDSAAEKTNKKKDDTNSSDILQDATPRKL